MWLLSFIFTLASASSNCPTYKCNAGYTKGECITESTVEQSSIYDQTICYPEYLCNPSESSTNCTLRQPALNYPGEFCSTNSQCTSGSCNQTTFICKGLSVGEACVNQYDCGPGLYCNIVSKICTNQVKVNNPCSRDNQCANGLICINLFCKSLFSIATGTQIDDTLVNSSTGFSLGCASGYAQYDEENQVYTCEVAPHSQEALPMKCTAGSTCTSSDKWYPKTCTCGVNPNGDSYCPLFEGDSYVQSMITAWKNLANLNANCNSNRRWGYQCFATMSTANQVQWYNWAANYTLYYNGFYPLIQENDQCTKQIETSSYWNIITALSESQQSIQCPVYFCGTDKTNWSAQQCIFYEKAELNYMITDILSLNPCSDGTSCPVLGSLNSTCTAPTTQLSYPGDYCKKNEDCASGSCKNKVCSGVALAGACTNIQDCNPGLYCNTTSKVCEAQKVEAVSCASDYECLNNMTCNLGICIPYYSLPVGSVTNNVNSAGLSRACNFGFANLTTTTAPLKGICAKPPVSPSADPILCQPGSKCLDKSGAYSKICSCGLNEFGYAYCPSFEGDIYLKNSIIHMKTLMSKNKICNTESRFEERCFLRDLDSLETYYFYVTNFTMYSQLPALQENTECVKSIYNEAFWRWMKESYDHSTGILITLASLLAVQVFI